METIAKMKQRVISESKIVECKSESQCASVRGGMALNLK